MKKRQPKAPPPPPPEAPAKPEWPLMDEMTILGYLSAPTLPDTIDMIQRGAILSVIDSFDRRILREKFIPLLQDCMILHSHMGRLRLLDSIGASMAAKKCTQKEIKLGLDNMIKDSEMIREKILKQMQMVAACPSSQDVKH